jgi:two-component system sensor histidine kinase KdpD
VCSSDLLGYLVIEEMREETGDPVRRMRIEMAAALVAGAVMRVRQAENAARLRTESDSERLRNLLLSSISHDLRTPLTVLGGTVANLMKMRRKLPREAMEEITSLSLQVGRLQTFTANLLKMAAIASGGLKLKRDAYVLQEVIGAATGRMAERLGGRQLRIAVVGDIPLVDIDGALIDQVITNLVENAIAHTADDGRIQISARRAGDKVEVSVADDGPGLPPGEEGRVFERFRSGATATDRKAIGGTGLGLAICRGIVEAHGGGISAGNGGVLPGAVFTFTLPLFAGEEQVWDDES